MEKLDGPLKYVPAACHGTCRTLQTTTGPAFGKKARKFDWFSEAASPTHPALDDPWMNAEGKSQIRDGKMFAGTQFRNQLCPLPATSESSRKKGDRAESEARRPAAG